MREQLALGGTGGALWMQGVGLLGALLVLAPYAALQMGRLTRESRLFNALNFAGSSLLTWIAVTDGRWGFILLEGVWALLSLPGMVRGRGE